MRLLGCLVLLPLILFAQGVMNHEPYTADEDNDDWYVESPEEIQEKIESSEEQLARAEKMFVPWYTGPLITPSPSIIPPGTMMLQPYVFINDNYGLYNNDHHPKSTPSLVNLNPFIFLETGLISWMDISALVQGQVNWLNQQSGGGIGDFTLSPGFKIYEQTVYVPQIKFFIQETFPTGTYDNLDPYKQGLDATGRGSYKTQVGFIFGKLILWQYPHPLRVRLAVTYTIPSPVNVSNFNVYGGGYGTRGTVRPGNNFSTDLGLELSLSQRWVFAMDVVYSATNKTTFKGYPGIALKGGLATVGGPSNDNLSIAPAIEYNWSANLGIIFGAQISVYGRNSSSFSSGILSVCYVFPLTR